LPPRGLEARDLVMAIEPKAIAIGLTGPFGSGSTTTAEILEGRMGYSRFRLSDLLAERWQKEHPAEPNKRMDLQSLGNKVRIESKNPGALADQAIKKLETDQKSLNHIVFDGIRNLGEIETFRDRFGQHFYLFALECPASERWERVEPQYKRQGLALEHFTADNERDRDQEDVYGQQVQLCVDQADVLLRNDDEVKMANLRKKVIEYVELVTGAKPRYARPEEILMNLAYSASHGSKCLKRQVGAILVAAAPGEMGDIVGQGFNENPIGTNACVEEPRYGADVGRKIPGKCFRDIVRHQSFAEHARRGTRCPNCGEKLKEPISKEPPWKCFSCSFDLEYFFWPERAMSWCTAVHAEVAAIMAAGWRAKQTTLYCTAHPCFQCAEKIVQAGIKDIVFTEPYPDVLAAERLQIAGIGVRRFEGVRSGRFDEIFSRARPYISEQRKILARE
jgi:deoxycytidylate deaminase